ncbi:hypothetical protein PAAG_12397 [Paracoccidioides lutzii Pb01]|uniref:Uncharacterized protein n=1 Tax=Paracoccidioides lutzii (strain ATCC MYA-826 / Pb01) TaxID=502779 RepID=A0A0A2V3G7_PARBA|nr:hypothetical protein PAAG_12397 [Paracoccidioides lutzii Pb01]KGQ00927.1 hypothetical protein PAAG_12397 [Paracoccidioides lutzii Pb01]
MFGDCSALQTSGELLLAIASVRNNALSKARKQRIALEFGYINTVLHDAPKPGLQGKMEIFNETKERSFSAQAILETMHYIFQKLEGHDYPHNTHVHAHETTKDEVLAVQRQLLLHPEDTAKMKGSCLVFSISLGVTFIFVDLSTCPALLSLRVPGFAPEPDLDDGWRVRTGEDSPSPFCGCMYFPQPQADFTEGPYITRLRVRVIAAGLEEVALAKMKATPVIHSTEFEETSETGKGAIHMTTESSGISSLDSDGIPLCFPRSAPANVSALRRPRIPGICGLVIQFYSNRGRTSLTTAFSGTTWKLWFDPALSRKRASRTAKYLQEYFFRIVTPKSLQNLYKVNELELKKKQNQRDRHGCRTVQDPSRMSREIFDVEIQQLQQLRPVVFSIHTSSKSGAATGDTDDRVEKGKGKMRRSFFVGNIEVERCPKAQAMAV